MSTKKDIRERLRKVLADTTREQTETESLQACHRLFAQREYVKAEVVMVFLSMQQSEPCAYLSLRCGELPRRLVQKPRHAWMGPR